MYAIVPICFLYEAFAGKKHGALSLSGGMNQSRWLFSRRPEARPNSSEAKAWKAWKAWHEKTWNQTRTTSHDFTHTTYTLRTTLTTLYMYLYATWLSLTRAPRINDQCGFSASTVPFESWVASQHNLNQFNRFISRRFKCRIHGVQLCQVTGFFTNALLPALARCGRSFGPRELQHATATDLDTFYRWRRYEPMFPPCPLGSLGDTVKFLNAEQFCSNLGLGRPVWCICIMMYIVNSHALSFLLIQNSERCCTSFIVSFIR